MARCGSCHTKKSCSLRIYPQRYTFRCDLRWQADKQRKHQNWVSIIENCIFGQVLFVCISKLHIFFNYLILFSPHSLWEHCNVNLHCIEKNLTIRNLSYQKKGFRDLKRILNHFEVSQHTTKPYKKKIPRLSVSMALPDFPIFYSKLLTQTRNENVDIWMRRKISLREKRWVVESEYFEISYH